MAKRDINEYSPDLMIDYQPIKEGRGYTRVRFFIRIKKTVHEGLQAWSRIEKELHGRRKIVNALPSGSFCFGCEYMNDEVCSAFPKCPYCGGEIEGQMRLL